VRDVILYRNKFEKTSIDRVYVNNNKYTIVIIVIIISYLDGPTSADLLQVVLNVVPADQCDRSYSSSAGRNLSRGIDDDSQLCAGHLAGGKDTCGVRDFHMTMYFFRIQTSVRVCVCVCVYTGRFRRSASNTASELHVHAHANRNNVVRQVLRPKRYAWRLHKSVELYLVDRADRLAGTPITYHTYCTTAA